MTTTFYEGFAVWLLMVGLVTATLLHHPLWVLVVIAPVLGYYAIDEIIKQRVYMIRCRDCAMLLSHFEKHPYC